MSRRLANRRRPSVPKTNHFLIRRNDENSETLFNVRYKDAKENYVKGEEARTYDFSCRINKRFSVLD